MVPVGVWSLGWSVGACRLWGRFEILYGYVNGALRFKLCHLWWVLGGVILLFKPAWFMLLVLWTLYSVSAFAFRAVSTSGCGVLFVFGPHLIPTLDSYELSVRSVRIPWDGCYYGRSCFGCDSFSESHPGLFGCVFNLVNPHEACLLVLSVKGGDVGQEVLLLLFQFYFLVVFT